jgi:ferredoxin-thioredoxin reductase catalytic subunit
LEKVRQRAQSDAQTYGYYLNPDPKFLQDLLEGLKTNEERYGYPSCPCRVASGNLEFDRDIICPCDYRDPDVKNFGYCYCGLYVRKDVVEGKNPVAPIPERRPAEKQARAQAASREPPKEKAASAEQSVSIKKKMWYCKQCGYVCFREDPPYICPICKARREMFAEIALHTKAQG